ncbi:MAG: signal peptidase I [Candidatus Zixiibacteriota bacterium]
MSKKKNRKRPNTKKLPTSEDKKNHILYSYVLPIAEVIFIIFVLRWLVLEAYQVPTGSMIDTIQPGDFLLVEKITYRFDPPDIGDVVVFEYPHDNRIKYVKRCIAEAGDTVEIRDKVVYVNGEKSPHAPTQLIDNRVFPSDPAAHEDPVELTHRWIAIAENDSLMHVQRFSPRDNFGPVIIPDGHLFALGDNRDNSLDSRFWGPVPMENITGRPTFIYLSTDLIDKIDPMSRRTLTMVDNVVLMLKSIFQFWHIRWDRMFMIIK